MEKYVLICFSSTTVGRLLILLTSVAGIIRCEQHLIQDDRKVPWEQIFEKTLRSFVGVCLVNQNIRDFPI